MARNVSHLSELVPHPLREALEHSAREHDRSLSAELRCAIRAYVSDPSGAGWASSSPSPASEARGQA